MTMQHRIAILIIAVLAAFAVTFGAAWVGYQSARADGSSEEFVVSGTIGENAPADAGVADLRDSGTSTNAPSSPATPPPPQASDVAVATKLYRAGDFFGIGILVVYLALFAWAKLDKKRAFYAATALGGIGILVESVRRGDTPSAVMVTSTLAPTVGLLIAGPNHAKAPAPSS